MEKGVDLKAYRSSFLMRHLESRAKWIGMKQIEQYPFYLKNHPEELQNFLDSISIKVTSFFRDSAPFRDFETLVIPELLKKKDGKLKIWSAGCATGEEAYSIAILLRKALEKEKKRWDIEILGTDMNEKFLEKAAGGKYSLKEVEGVNSALLEKFFKSVDGRSFEIKVFLKNWMKFQKHDLLKSDGFPGQDVIFCRNVFIYLNREAQKNLVFKFVKNLSDFGFLVLGRSELMLAEAASLFTPVSLSGRIYQKRRAIKGGKKWENEC
ncbi:MAG: protein-glutamate O-methyltransferase CheR [Candidatus Eremiobacteraeota bacterium]|jgi:chemotaxis protein methyltransferase CheR|nr:protein-glutamate O-methyltransferase CheR [Candidatus Eremiobacteraeota bacterium]MCL5055633.1 protein-glutamate O-methyltransferase CheR [Bacillota bacterium]